MSMAKRRSKIYNNPNQLNLFEVLEALREARTTSFGGSLNIQQQIKNIISEALKGCPLSRWQVAAQMSELAGIDITKGMLDAWSAESREYHRFPLEFVPAFCRVTGNYELLRFVCESAGCYMAEGEEVILAEFGRLDRKEAEIGEERKKLHALWARFAGENKERPDAGNNS
jgi:hypothetical protein